MAMFLRKGKFTTPLKVFIGGGISSATRTRVPPNGGVIDGQTGWWQMFRNKDKTLTMLPV